MKTNANPIFKRIKRIWYYHLHFNTITVNNKFVGTVCLIKSDDGFFHRGIAICAELDNPDKAFGKKLAFNRAVHALATKTSNNPINHNDQYSYKPTAIMVTLRFPSIFKYLGESFSDSLYYKSQFCAILNDKELRIVCPPPSILSNEKE